MPKRQTYQEIIEGGNRRHLTKEQLEARRLADEAPMTPAARAVGLTRQERRAWDALFERLADKLVVSDADSLNEAARLRAALPGIKKQGKDEHSAAVAKLEAILQPIEARTPRTAPVEQIAATVAQEPVQSPNCKAEAVRYARNLVEGQIPSCKLARLAAQRFLNDLNATDEGRGFHFDEAKAQRPVDFIVRLRLGELQPYQHFIIANAFGFVRADGTRRFRQVFVEIAKKNGKSGLCAALGLYLASPASIGGDGEERPVVAFAATSRYQSSEICFKEAARLRENYGALVGCSKQYKTSITFPDTHGSCEPLAANSEKLNGLNLHGLVADELADHKTADLFNTLASAQIGRKQPISIAITTAGSQREGNIAWEQRGHAAQVLEGMIQDDGFFAFICEIDEGDSPFDEACWIKANPAMGSLVPLANLQDAAHRAKTVNSARSLFYRYHINRWSETSVNAWLSVEVLQKPVVSYISDEDRTLTPRERIEKAKQRLAGRLCYGGLDASKSNDLTCFSALFPPLEKGGIYEALFLFWCPQEAIIERSKSHRVPYERWSENGYIKPTHGAVIDLGVVEEDIVAFSKTYRLNEVGYDIAYARDTERNLGSAGIKSTQVTQGFKLSPAICEIEKWLAAEKLSMHGHPIAVWNFSNAVINHGTHDVRLDKAKSREKIDAAASLADATDIFMKRPAPARDWSYEGLVKNPAILTL